MRIAAVGVVTLVLIAGLGGGWSWLSRSDRDRPHRSEGPSARSGLEELERQAEAEQRPGVSALAERRAFEILRGRSEPMPLGVRVVVRSALEGRDGSSGLRFDQAQHVRVGQGGIWVLSGKGVVCLVQAALGALQCNLLSEALDQGVSLGILRKTRRGAPGPPRRFVAIGVAPDWATAVLLRVGGATRRVRIRRNVYAMHASEPIWFARLERGSQGRDLHPGARSHGYAGSGVYMDDRSNARGAGA